MTDLSKIKLAEKNVLDKHLDYLQWRHDQLYQYFSDQESNKLKVLGGALIVFSVLVSILSAFLATVDVSSKEYLEPPRSMLLLLVLFGIAIINLSIIKYIAALKKRCILATREMTCLLQAMLSNMYERTERHYTDQTRLDTSNSHPTSSSEYDLRKDFTIYWVTLGRHIKFPINNIDYRNKYRAKKVVLESADMFTIIMVAIYTILLVSSPMAFILSSGVLSNNSQVNPMAVFFLGVSSFAITFIFGLGTYLIVSNALKNVRDAMEKDEGIHVSDNEKKD